jgi:hypothetical protein
MFVQSQLGSGHWLTGMYAEHSAVRGTVTVPVRSLAAQVQLHRFINSGGGGVYPESPQPAIISGAATAQATTILRAICHMNELHAKGTGFDDASPPPGEAS